MLVKKYSNRRLYDTDSSAYITLEELADKIRRGANARVVDAKTGDDLTQPTLAQIILESRGAAKMLPTKLLVQLIRMGDDALSEFLGRYLSAALDLYLQAKQGAQQLAPVNPFAALPFAATSALARLLSGASGYFDTAPQQPSPAPPPPSQDDDIASMRREIEELKRSMRKPKRKS